MKKNISRMLTLALALALTLALAACGGQPAGNSPANSPASNSPADSPEPSDNTQLQKDWAHVSDEEWVAEAWDSKTPAYQLTGQWDMGDPEYNFVFDFLLNFFDDGSARVNQYSAEQGDYYYFGFWSEEETEDGNEITLTIRRETPLPGETELVSHKYSYTLYEEADGSYSFGFDFGMIPGQYFRVADVSGSDEIVYKSIADFHAASEAGAFDPEEPADGGEEQAPADGGEGETASYPAHTMVLPFTPDTSEQLKTEFYCDAGTWGAALGASGTYEPTGSDEVILSWVSDGSENYHLDFKGDGTYEYSFTTVGATESGAWSFTDWTLSVTTANGNTFTASITG